MEAVQGARLAIDLVATVRPDLPLPLAATAGVRGGVPLSLVVGDSAVGARAMDQFDGSDQVLGLVVSDPASVETVFAGRAEALGVPLIDAGAEDSPLGDVGGRRSFRIAPTDRALARAALGLLRERRAMGTAVRRITVVESGSDRSTSMVAAVREEAAAGMHDVSALRYNVSAVDSAALAGACSSGGADVILATVTSSAEARIATQLGDRLKDKIPVIGVGQARDTTGRTSAAPAALRAVGWSAAYIDRNPVAKEIAELYTSRFRAAMTETAATAFTATLVLAQAVNAAKRPDGDGVEAALRRTWLPATQVIMPWNGIRFDTGGDNELAAGVVEQKSTAGTTIVYPAELAAGKPVWPSVRSSAKA